jgi:hypothetical protein
MNLLKKMTLTIALVATFGTSAFASPVVTQTTAPTSSDTCCWSQASLGSITLASGTDTILGLTSTMTIWDQGWGGEDATDNQVIIGLFDNGVGIWGQHVAGGFHNVTTQTFDISSDPTALASLNAALDGIDWSAAPTVTMQMISAGLGYPGWELHTSNASFSVTSVPEPTSIALLGLGLFGFAAARRRKQ